MRTLLMGLMLLFLQQHSAHAQTLTGQQYAEDFLFMWQELANNYAYFDQRQNRLGPSKSALPARG